MVGDNKESAKHPSEVGSAEAKPGMLGVHDAGGSCKEAYNQSIDLEEPPTAFWERKVHAMFQLIAKRGLMTTDELRVGVESLEDEVYADATYYEKWASSITRQCIDRHIFAVTDLYQAMGVDTSVTYIAPRFAVGDTVTVKAEDFSTHWRKPHLRTPGYIFGARGEVIEVLGEYGTPELKALGSDYTLTQTLYKVRFNQAHIWKAYEGGANDTLDADVYDMWLNDGTAADSHAHVDLMKHSHAHAHDDSEAHSHSHGDGDGHAHDHGDHVHEQRSVVEQTAVDREGPLPPLAPLADTLEKVFIQKNIFTAEDLRKEIEVIDGYGQDYAGARLVVRAWKDEAFKQRLLTDSKAPMAEEGIPKEGEVLPARVIVVANTPTAHNVVVCTLCSCYPIALLGLSPPWYKSRSYRSRIVFEPRKVLKEFGTDIPKDVAIRVHDSTADVRYLVIPERPSGSENCTDEELLRLVTRDSMIGVTRL
ncbi:hypothetical protein SARC_06007 [Sphaeroforma arctica JP610]|uniref:nitrile hydratase n=1 Tax=Sphaeroforma arctica JP610 TaxID=667725 RepID=A0A0L0FXY1_9EUKA|nr:hypothetical protein SARC_06007 [Sphaeroforma arctica JP610]KNC81677.1 hypothetical protein SARC_06007 [Sphaeroforma arctica JP610]|eukprot:XP_014155579.1 hypothetical protein SARC_06007 [Sphaeroforma arctica JP610]